MRQRKKQKEREMEELEAILRATNGFKFLNNVKWAFCPKLNFSKFIQSRKLGFEFCNQVGSEIVWRSSRFP